MAPTMIFVDFTDIMERAARNGTKAHLPTEVVRAIVQHPGYAAYQAERIKEIASQWDDDRTPEERSSGSSGCGIGQSGTNGPSAGTMTEAQAEDVGHAASQLASEAVARIGRRGRRRTPLPPTT